MAIAGPVEEIDRHAHTRPRSAKLHLFESEAGHFALDVESGHIHPLPAGHADVLDATLRLGDPGRAELTALAFGIMTPVAMQTRAPANVPVKAISLAVAQTCNLGCTYCYAQQGTFGGTASSMPPDVARAAIDRLVGEAASGESLTLAFMGGEPLVSRQTLHASTRYAASAAAARGIRIGFTMTTNATLLNDEDIALFEEYGFTLTVSLDGLQATHDNLRPYRSGNGSFEQVARNVKALLAAKRRRYRVLARVTVTPKNLDLPEIMSGLLDMGFDAIMFSPMVSAPSGKDEMDAADLDRMLEQLIRCGDIFRDSLRQGRILPFSNVITTLQRIHFKQREQYPCGAGGGYMGVSAEGGLYACHRFVNDEDGLMGDVFTGVDQSRQSNWLDSRHLQKQSPCSACWARYLCSGSCHYESIKRGRPACDYIRGWLNYCLVLYTELLRSNPDNLQRILTVH
ncbi:radical SAM protein [Bradyrhizobium sp. CB82]|uniref:radical SAM/SPASM domain-containing protein n=1 Tax=Bradyrhizobium sp. CB82 TaxID=3039159 RepID=UPI0024B0982B|nr:radical SAM protein [Bradyrhizobium sp. CB82]WFU44158.1 radical SAM protein [Bradyrhizobium sp. CB82]